MKINYLKLKEVSKRRIWKTINLGKYVSDELYQNPLHWKPDGYTMILLCIPEEKMTAYQYTPKKRVSNINMDKDQAWIIWIFYFILL